MRRHGKSRRPSFTLVELLVVIVIIAILASFLVVGVMAALRRGKEQAIRTEVMGLAAAIEAYKNQYDHYPPSYVQELQPHVAQIHPRCGQSVPTDPPMTVDQVLYFWLVGYVTNPQKPLYGDVVTENGLTATKGFPTPFFDFDKKRLSTLDNPADEKNLQISRARTYTPKGSRGSIPYVYFRKIYNPDTQNYNWGTQEYDGNGNSATIGRVYFDNEVLKVDEKVGTETVTRELAKNLSKDYVIISAGLESKYTKDGIITSLQDGTKDD